MFAENQINIKEEENQVGDDSGKVNEESDAGIWTVETLRRRLKIGVMKKGKIDVKKARREMLAAYIWKEESTRIEEEEEEEEEEEKQKERRTKRTGTETTEVEEENKNKQEETEAAQKTWETRQASKNMGDEALEGMGFNGRVEPSSRGERIRKREQYQKSNETYEYPREKDSKTPKTQHIKERTETERGLRKRNKRKRTELKERLGGHIKKWSQGETKNDKITENAKKVQNKVGKATTELIRKVIRHGMETEKISTTEEIYNHNKYIILDVSWGQFIEGATDRTKTIFRGKEAYSKFQRTVKSGDKVIAIIHHAHHWSCTVINTRERKLQMYNSIVKAGHKKRTHS